MLKVTTLQCDYRTRPLGVDNPRPRLSWRLESDRPGARQSACRIRVATSPGLAAAEADVWDSGCMESDRSVQVLYGGPALVSRQRYWWHVEVWTAGGEWAAAREPEFWETGLLEKTDWRARWISASPAFTEPSSTPPCPLLRREFELVAPPAAARCYVCGLGFYELYVNGVKVGAQVLDPAFTRYDKRVLYATHDIGPLLRAGRNALGVMLGNGWYNCQAGDAWNFPQASWRSLPKLILQCHVAGAGDEETVICSDRKWTCHDGPVLFSDLRQGETYDARMQVRGWTAPGFDDSAWAPAHIVPPPGGVLRSQQCPPIRETEVLRAAAMRRTPSGRAIYDFGRSIAGYAQLNVAGAAGREIELRHAETLTPEGELDAGNLSGLVHADRFQTDKYILDGNPVEVWSPRFVYHGFRYIEVAGLSGALSPQNLFAIAAHTDLRRCGAFTCSHELLNEINTCLLRSTLYNYHGMPTDCPHREKNGWTGDAHLSAEQALFNFDMAAAYTKWLDDLADAQRPSGQLPGIVPSSGWGYNFGSGPAWDSAYPLVAWYLYLYLGDVQILERHFANLARYVDYLGAIAEDGIIAGGLGDWCPPEGGPAGHECPAALTSTGYYYASARIVAESAKILGRAEAAERYAAVAQAVKTALLGRFFDRETGIAESASQTAQACILYHGLLDDDPAARRKALGRLMDAIAARDFHLWTGILGAKYVFQALTDNDRVDVALRLATRTSFPGWGHWIAQGATTLWECWDGSGSRLHHMFSDIGAWFHKALAGITPDPARPGFKHALLKPHAVPGLDWAESAHESLHGTLSLRWERRAAGVHYRIAIPGNTTATVMLEGSPEHPPTCRQPAWSPAFDGARWVAELGAGSWTIRCRAKQPPA